MDKKKIVYVFILLAIVGCSLSLNYINKSPDATIKSEQDQKTDVSVDSILTKQKTKKALDPK